MTVISDFDIDEQKPSRRLWVLAGVIALSLHLGGAAFALMHLAANQDDSGLGANTDEYAVEMVSPKVLDD
ncbi:MAG: energy transducer TonB, partial [Bradyrhizobium sp.]|nr:energy transducer TonB [Bradyrhizobium sp.]